MGRVHADDQQRNQPEVDRGHERAVHRRELDRIAARASERGLTLVPTRIYFAGPNAKVEIALARGKDRFDKRESIKAREQRRDMDRAVQERH